MNDRFAPIAVGKVAPPPTHIPAPSPSMALLYGAMDDTAEYAVANAAVARFTDAQIEQFTDQADEASRLDAVDDMRHTLRVIWNEALASLGRLNPRKLPIVAGGKVVLVSLPDVLTLCGETNHLYVLLADVLRGANADVLHIHLRSTYVEGFAEKLVDLGWQQ